MAAYLIVNIDVHDPVRYEEYKRQTSPIVASYGGKYLVRGGEAEVLEGDCKPSRMVVIEFESIERAKRWWSSPEYSEVKHLRHETADTQMIIVEGFSLQTAGDGTEIP